MLPGLRAKAASGSAPSIINPEAAREGTGDAGAITGCSNYQVYLNSAHYPSTAAANPCSTGTLFATFSAASYAGGSAIQYDLTGLSPRTNYNICLKAVDAAGN